MYRIRRQYLKALLRQNVGWYDVSKDKNFVSRITEYGYVAFHCFTVNFSCFLFLSKISCITLPIFRDLMKVQEATGEKLGLCIFFIMTSVLSLGNAFWHGWKLTLVILSSAPVLAIATGIVAGIQSRLTSTEQTSYAKSGNVAEEAFNNIRTVMAFNGTKKEIERYVDGLSEARVAGKKRGAISGLGLGLMWLIIYASYALAFWYGSKLIIEGRSEKDPAYKPSNMIVVSTCSCC